MIDEPISLSDIAQGRPVCVFFRHWQSKSADGRVMLRSEFRPFDFPSVIPWLLILQSEPGETRPEYRIRLFGTGCTEIFRKDYTGQLLSQAMPASMCERRHRELDDMAKTGTPIFTRSDVPFPGREFLTVIRGIFPVSASGGGIDQIFAIIAGCE